MFTWDKSLQVLDITANQVLNLFRSMRDVQMALPGLPSQQASAYLCQYQLEKGVATVAAFHMQKSNQLAFYCSDPKLVGLQQADGMFDQALNFVESMGFLLADLDIHLLAGKLVKGVTLDKGGLDAFAPENVLKGLDQQRAAAPGGTGYCNDRMFSGHALFLFVKPLSASKRRTVPVFILKPALAYPVAPDKYLSYR